MSIIHIGSFSYPLWRKELIWLVEWSVDIYTQFQAEARKCHSNDFGELCHSFGRQLL